MRSPRARTRRNVLLTILIACLGLLGIYPNSASAAPEPAVQASVMTVKPALSFPPASAFENLHALQTAALAVKPAPVPAAAPASKPVSAPTTVTIPSGSNLSKAAAELSHGWTWQKLCEHTQPALADCSVVAAGTVIHLDGPTHPLPTTPAVHSAAAAVSHTVTAVSATPVHVSAPAGYASMSHQQLMAAAGIASSDFYFVDKIVSHESGWCPTVNNGEVGCPSYHGTFAHKAYGECQALPAVKMASAGADWATNPVTQLRWCDSYAKSAYGSWANAWAHWYNQHWW